MNFPQPPLKPDPNLPLDSSPEAGSDAGDTKRPAGPAPDQAPTKVPADADSVEEVAGGPTAAWGASSTGGAPLPRDEPELPAELTHHPRYRILGLLGHGGMGTVYKAWQISLNRLVALKVIRPGLVDQHVLVERFLREMAATAQLTHPNIVRAYDSGLAGDAPFLVLEYVFGANLDQKLAEVGRLAVTTACDYARQTALGLHCAYLHHMVHRDIKPHNLMLTPEEQIKILDFGLARYVSEEIARVAGRNGVFPYETAGARTLAGAAAADLTNAYTGLGTLDYLAPEEARDARRADIRADIYGLGCTLYRFLAGRVPFPGGSAADKLRCHRESAPEPLTELRSDVSTPLAQVVTRMMAKDPAQRYHTPAEVAAALAPFTRDRPGSILVVEDEVAIREAMALALEQLGYTVLRAGDGREALEIVRRTPAVGLILLDLMMPVMDGSQFVHALRQDPKLASIRICVITAADPEQAQVHALGAVGYLQKPFAEDEFAALVRQQVGAG